MVDQRGVAGGGTDPREQAGAAGPTLITSVRRALNLINAVGSASRPVTAKALARQTKMALPTAYHLLRTLVYEGYLVRQDGGYLLGERVRALSEPEQAGLAGMRYRAWPALRWLHDGIRAAAYLAVYDDGEVRLVEIVDSADAPRVDLWVGLEAAGHACALGKALLAALNEDERRDYLHRHDLPDLTPFTVTDRRALLGALTRQPQLALDRQEYQLGAACVAVPIRTTRGPGAVAISFPASRMPKVLARAEELQRAASLMELELSR